ncbi:uncharacterized protein LOC131667015 [Phymastichus coffea]|uniref:uncharacterized protein LOC131667015 n=1 Tax=Phymastichus coffea TaxID=108790 RepID=UPI00273C8567|nr:uncharacterized protein LOC131667015 [Phymastichus coffea]
MITDTLFLIPLLWSSVLNNKNSAFAKYISPTAADRTSMLVSMLLAGDFSAIQEKAKRPHACVRCGKSYMAAASLSRHRRLECGVQPSEVCHLCDRKFRHRFVLKQHVFNFQLLLLALEDISDILKEILRNQIKGCSAKLTSQPVSKVNQPKTNVDVVAGDLHLDTIWSDREFAEKYALELPLKELCDFLMFDQILKENPDVRRDFMSMLPCLVDRHNLISKSTTNILRKFISRSVVMRFTVQKKISDKIILKDTQFCKCAVDVLMKMHRDNHSDLVTEKDVFSAFGSSLNNAKDWDGYRSQRKEKKTSDNNQS